jgi:hypothetical protein
MKESQLKNKALEDDRDAHSDDRGPGGSVAAIWSSAAETAVKGTTGYPIASLMDA